MLDHSSDRPMCMSGLFNEYKSARVGELLLLLDRTYARLHDQADQTDKEPTLTPSGLIQESRPE